MTTPLWLAFDIGTTGAKAALIQANGKIVKSAYREYPLYRDGMSAEQNPAEWWQAVIDTARELVSKVDIRQVAAIAITGQMQDVILVGTDGNPLRRAILYSDTRAQEEADEVNNKIGAERLAEITGNYQDASGLLAKLLWIAKYERNLLSMQGALLFGAADYISLRLTGKAMTDTTTASTTGLLDIETRELLDRRVFDALGVGNALRRLMPTVQPGGSYAGAVTQIAANTLGIEAGIPVYLGPGDAGAITLGVGAGEIGHVYGYIGTSGWIGFTSDSRAQAEGTWTLAHPDPSLFLQVAPLLTAGGNLEWVRDLFGSDDYDGLIEQALQRPPTNLLYLPYLQGERSPFRDPFARGTLVGLNMQTEKADVYRAVLEGVCYAYRHAFESLVTIPVEQVTLTGGGTISRGWTQLFADIFGTALTVLSDHEFVGVRGATLAAQVSASQIKSYAVSRYFTAGQTVAPTANYRDYYERKYTQYLALYPALKPIFGAMG